MGLSPRSAKLQVTSLPHIPSPRSPSCLRLFLFVDQTPPHSSSPGSSTRTAPALPSRPFSCSVILPPIPKRLLPCFSL
jgi:hypothetical protein